MQRWMGFMVKERGERTMLSVEQINKLENENEELREAYNNILTSCKNEQQTNEQLKKVLKDIRATIDFECECKKGEMCICNVCDKYDAIIAKIDGALKEDADK